MLGVNSDQSISATKFVVQTILLGKRLCSIKVECDVDLKCGDRYFSHLPLARLEGTTGMCRSLKALQSTSKLTRHPTNKHARSPLQRRQGLLEPTIANSRDLAHSLEGTGNWWAPTQNCYPLRRGYLPWTLPLDSVFPCILHIPPENAKLCTTI